MPAIQRSNYLIHGFLIAHVAKTDETFSSDDAVRPVVAQKGLLALPVEEEPDAGLGNGSRSPGRVLSGLIATMHLPPWERLRYEYGMFRSMRDAGRRSA